MPTSVGYTYAVLLCAAFPAAVASGQSSALEEVVVAAPRIDTMGLAGGTSTASRLGVDVLDLPSSASIVEQSTVQTKGLRTVIDAANGTTGLVGYARAGAAGVYSWRGFTENAVATLYDGIRVQGSTVTTRLYDAFAFERVEIARGPGSALHGEGALAGAINYVRKRPERRPDTAVDVLAGLGTQDLMRGGLGVNARVSEQLHARVDVAHQRHDTQVRGNESRITHALASLLADVTPDLSMLFQVDHLRARTEDAYWGTPVIDGRIPFELRRVNYNNANDNLYEDDVTWLRWDTRWQISQEMELRNQAYWYDADRNWRNIGRFLWNAGSSTVGRTFWEDLAYEHRLYGNRLELAVDSEIAGRRNRLVAGADISRTDFASPRNYSAPFGLQQQVDPFAPPAVDFFEFGRPRVQARETDVRQWAVFLEDRLELDGRWALHGSLRRDSLDVDFERYDTATPQFYSADYSPVTWTMGVTRRVGEGASVYAQAGTSATPADSLLVIGDPATAALDLTKGRGAEIGFKQRLADGRVEWTAAVYRLEQRHIPSTDPDDPTRTRVIGEQSSQGIELAIAWRPVAALLIEANAALLEAEYDTFFEGTEDRAGNRPPNVSERVVNLDVDYAITSRWSAGMSLRHVGDFAANTSNSIVFPSYTLADLRVRHALNADTELAVFVNNVFDERYAAWATGAGGQNVMANIGASRTAGVQMRTRF